ncbi:MAG: CRISPR-associated ring nuclease Csm6 [Methylophilaceae bacterium]|nr:CRISPR-associated ring nuclease Csm6 [Methylophilaceae bacterium]
MIDPQSYPRRILLAVTGLSPQVVTETLYALTVAQTPPFSPTEIHLLTTAEGARMARTALLHPDGGQFHALLADWPQVGTPHFDESCIHVITGPDGMPLSDIRTPEQNAAAADAITARVAELTADENSALHVSIAGGRKTMGFYLGYAFSLFARPQDRLSHVLVSAPFESHPEFFYPPRSPRRLATRDGGHIDTADAEVTLADIPFVRLRHGLPEVLLKGMATFSETVAALQKSFAPPQLEIDWKNRRVVCGGTPVTMPRQIFAWYAWHAHRRANLDDPFIHWRDIDPNDFLDIYAKVAGKCSAAYEKIAQQLPGDMEQFFQQKNAKANRALITALGHAASPYLITATGKRPYSRHGLALPRQAIRWVT